MEPDRRKELTDAYKAAYQSPSNLSVATVNTAHERATIIAAAKCRCEPSEVSAAVLWPDPVK